MSEAVKNVREAAGPRRPRRGGHVDTGDSAACDGLLRNGDPHRSARCLVNGVGGKGKGALRRPGRKLFQEIVELNLMAVS